MLTLLQTKVVEVSVPPEICQPAQRRMLESYSDAAQYQACRRQAYVDALCSQTDPSYTPSKVLELITRIAKRIGDAVPPCPSTVYRWHHAFMQSGCDALALIPRFDLRGGAGQRISGERLEILDRVVQEKYLALRRLSIRATHTALIAEIARINATRPKGEELPEPSYDTVRRFIHRLPAYEVDLARYGQEYARKKYRSSAVVPPARFLLERVEIDHTPLDLFVIDDVSRLVLGRPYVTWGIESLSREIMGFYISFSPPSVEAVFACLKHMISRKDYVPTLYPDIKHDWPACGVPCMAVVDNALEFHAQDMRRATFELGIDYRFCPPRTPWFKPMVERSLRSLAEQFAHLMPGTSFARWFERYGYDPMKQGIVTLPELIHALHIWIVDVYSQSYHRGIKTTPYAAWLKGAEISAPTPFDADRLTLILSQEKSRVLGHAGVELHGLRYNSEEMLMLRKQMGDRVRVNVRFNADDLGMINVIHPMTKEAIPVPCLTPEYARGLRLVQHVLIQNALKAEGLAVTNKVQLALAKEHMLDVVGRLMVSTKYADRKRSAKARGSNSSTIISQQPKLLAEEPETVPWRPKVGADSPPTPVPVMNQGMEDGFHGQTN